MTSKLRCSVGCLMTHISRRPGSPFGSYVLSNGSVMVDGFMSCSRTGWSAGCRMYFQPNSAKAARYAVRIHETRARSGKYLSRGVTVKRKSVLRVSLSMRMCSSMRSRSAGLLISGTPTRNMPAWPTTSMSTLVAMSPTVKVTVSDCWLSPERNCRRRCCLRASASKWRPASLLHLLQVSTSSLPPSAFGGTCSTLNCSVSNSSTVSRTSRQAGQRYQSWSVGKASSNPRSRATARRVRAPL